MAGDAKRDERRPLFQKVTSSLPLNGFREMGTAWLQRKVILPKKQILTNRDGDRRFFCLPALRINTRLMSFSFDAQFRYSFGHSWITTGGEMAVGEICSLPGNEHKK